MASDVQRYLDELQTHLTGHLTATEISDVVNFYGEYLQDADLTDRAQIESRLGTAKQLAHKVLADYSLTTDDTQEKTSPTANQKIQKRGGLSNVALIWIIVLAIASSPLTIPLAIAVLAVLLAGGLTLIGIALTAVLMVGLILVMAAVAIYTGIMLLFTKMNVALFYLGAGVAGIGALFVGIPLAISVLRWVIAMLAIALSWLYRKITKKQPKVKEAHHEENN